MLDAEPLTVAGGEFRLFAPDDEVDVQHMTYRLPLAADDGREWFLTGIKVIDRGQLRDLWHDTTTLYVDIHEGTDDSGPVVYRGVLEISMHDFTRQLRTMKVDNAQSESQRLRLLARFGAMFAGNLWGHYGGIFGDVTPLDPDAPPRVKRPLRCGVPGGARGRRPTTTSSSSCCATAAATAGRSCSCTAWARAAVCSRPTPSTRTSPSTSGSRASTSGCSTGAAAS